MYGCSMRVEFDGFGITLRPYVKSEMSKLSEYFQSMEVVMFLNLCYANTTEDEEEWYEKSRKDRDTVIWAIVPDKADHIVGSTGLHGVHSLWGCATSGIVIADRSWWGKGVAYRAHLARTWYAVNILNRLTIQSGVRAPNEASLKALLKVGYRVSGKHDRSSYRMGKYMDTYILSWVNPRRTDVLYPEGAPEELRPSLQKASEALDFADQVVKLL